MTALSTSPSFLLPSGLLSENRMGFGEVIENNPFYRNLIFLFAFKILLMYFKILKLILSAWLNPPFLSHWLIQLTR